MFSSGSGEKGNAVRFNTVDVIDAPGIKTSVY